MKNKRITFDRDDMDYINEMQARDYATRTQAQMSATIFAVICLSSAGCASPEFPRLAISLFALSGVFALISWIANPDK